MEGIGNKNDRDNFRDNGIMDSIAALRSVLMLDTPTRVALSGSQPQRQPWISPMAQAKSPDSKKKSPVERTPLGKPPMSNKRLSSVLKTKSTTKIRPSPEMDRVGTVMKKKVEALETSQTNLEKKLQVEIDRRSSLQATHEKLSDFQTQQTSQLERMIASRDAFRAQVITLKKTIEEEQINHMKAVSTMKNATKTMIESLRSKDKEESMAEIKTLEKRLRQKEERYQQSESLVKSLTKEVEKLNADLKTRQGTHEVAMKATTDAHAKEISLLQDIIERTESDRLEHTEKEKEIVSLKDKLEKAQTKMDKMEQDHISVTSKMESDKADLENSLIEMKKLRDELREKLEDASGELTQLHRQVEEALTASKTSEEKLRDQLTAYKALQSEKKYLERRMSDAKDIPSTATSTKELQVTIQKLESEKQALEQRANSSDENCKRVKKLLEGTQMELKGLEQNLEEAERIESQNEILKKDLEEANNGVSCLKEKLDVCESSNANLLVEVATYREKVRDLEGRLEELEERDYCDQGENTDGMEKKRDNDEDDDNESPRKRPKMRVDDQDQCVEESEIAM